MRVEPTHPPPLRVPWGAALETNVETLASLVAKAADEGGRTFAELAEAAVDPLTGYQPGSNMLWKVARQKGVKVNPKLVRAIAAGIRMPLERVQAAAAFEFTGYVATKVDGGTLIHAPGVDAADTPKAQAILERWAKEQGEGEAE